MIEAIKLWNEPNNLSHWDFTMDTQWKEFSCMTRLAAHRLREVCPELSLVLGRISPIDPPCFTPPSRGKRACHTSPPLDPVEFADFAEEVVRRYVLGEKAAFPPLEAREDKIFLGS